MSIADGEMLSCSMHEAHPLRERVGVGGHPDHLFRGVDPGQVGVGMTAAQQPEKGTGAASDIEDAPG